MGILARAAAVATILAAQACSAAQATPEYQVKVVLLDKLTRFVDWPSGGNPGRAFVLAVLGRTPFGDDLDAYFASHLVKNRPVTVRYLHQAAEVKDCDLLFICASEQARLGAILEPLKGRPILTVADSEGFAQAGVMVSMVRAGGKITFEVNLAPVRDAGFRMAPGFLQLVRIVP